MTGIFQELVNERSFLDRVVVNVSGNRRTKPLGALRNTSNTGIAGSHSPYARLLSGESALTLNRVQWKYGKFLQTPWRHKLAPYQLSVKSDHSPVTCSEVEVQLGDFMTVRARHSIALAEFTFDTVGFSFEQVRRDLFTSAQTIYEHESHKRRRTLYVGSPRSKLQLRVYEKTARILRFEFVLRPDFLSSIGVSKAHHLLRLRQIDLWTFAHWQELWPVTTMLQFPKGLTGYRLQAASACMNCCSSETERWLRREHGVSTQPLLKRSDIETILRRMQSRLVW